MIAIVKTKFHSPGGYELSGDGVESIEIPDATYAIEDIIRVGPRRLIVTGREWEDGKVVRVTCNERRPISVSGLDAVARERWAKGREKVA